MTDDLPTRTPAGTIYEIEAMKRDMDRRAYERTAAWRAKADLSTRYLLCAEWGRLSGRSMPSWSVWLFAYFAPRIDPGRLLTAGDKLLRGCSHAEAIPTFDHTAPPWKFAPPVGLTCPTCGTIHALRRQRLRGVDELRRDGGALAGHSETKECRDMSTITIHEGHTCVQIPTDFSHKWQTIGPSWVIHYSKEGETDQQPGLHGCIIVFDDSGNEARRGYF